MRKDEVTFHSDGYQEPRPAVNVKVHGIYVDYQLAAEKFAEQEISDGDERVAFLIACEGMDDESAQTWFEVACQDGWEQMQTDAEEIFGEWVKVYGEGRSGGWAVVEGLPDFESWDAIMLSKWAKFARYARDLADNVPYMMAELFYLNRFQPSYDKDQPFRRGLVGAGAGL